METRKEDTYERERERERKREFLGPFKEKNGKLGNFCFSLFRF